MSPYMKRRASKGAMMSTPTKKPVRSAVELDRAAKKECPFRDLNPKKILFS